MDDNPSQSEIDTFKVLLLLVLLLQTYSQMESYFIIVNLLFLL